MLPDRLRYQLKLDPQLGAGNFLYRALSLSPQRDVAFIHSDEPFHVFGTTLMHSMSLAAFKDVADRYAAWYLERGISPMDPVAVYFADGLQYAIQYVALTAIGAIPVLTNGAMPPDVATVYFERVGVTGIVTDRTRKSALGGRMANGALKVFDALEDIDGADAETLPAWYPFAHDHDDPVMITHSSGTTGTPKAVLLQHGRWFHGIRQLLGLTPAQGAESYLTAVPSSHNAFIAHIIHAALNGAQITVVTDRRGSAVRRAIERFRPSTVMSFPDVYVELAEQSTPEERFDSVTTWINTGDAAHETHIRRLVAHGYHYRGEARVRGSQFVDGLGSSEMGHSSFRIIHTPYTNTYDRCVGFPQEWVEAAVLDDDGHMVPTGTVGRLGVRSPSVTQGYWNDCALTYRSRMRGYWLTGDLVYRDHLGCFYHLDRISDAIPTADGPLYSLQTEELILKHQQCLADCTVIGARQPIGAGNDTAPVMLGVMRPGYTDDPAVLLATVNRVQGALGRPRIAAAHLVERGDLPVGVTGKVLKRALRERIEAAS